MQNTGYPCPACGASADLGSGCSGCGRPPYPAAAEVVRLDREIVALGGEVERARAAYQGLVDRLGATRQRRAALAAAIRAEFPVPRPAAPAPVRPAPAAAPAPVRPAPGVTPPGTTPVPAWPGRGPVAPVPVGVGGAETSTRTVQSLLFVLGGLLLGTAAVVFTAVAWAAVGVAGRALILFAFTALALAVPLVAVRRGLRGTAETFAAVGLLLVLLDGYAAWSVDLVGVADWPGTRYAALVGGASAAVAAGYARLSGLTVPWFAALLTAQPVLPLLAADARPDAAGWSMVFLGVALLDLAVLVALRRRGGPATAAVPIGPAGGATSAGGPATGAATAAGAVGGTPAAAGVPARPAGERPAVLAGRVLAWVGHAGALLVAACCALVPLTVGRAAGVPLLAGAPLLLVALTLLGTALLTGGAVFRSVAAALLVPVLAGAVVRPLAELGLSPLLTALVVVALAGAVRLLPAGWRTGPRAGALLVAGVTAQLAVLLAVALASATAGRSLPPWQGADAGPDLGRGWQLPVVIALAVAALALLLPRPARPALAAIGGAAVVLAVPAGWPSPWPAVVALDLVAAVGLLAVAVGRPGVRSWTVLAAGGAGTVLLGHALVVGFAAPVGAGAALAVVLVAGTAVAAAGRRGTPAQRRMAGTALAVVPLAVPAGAVVALLAAGAPAWWQARAALAAVALLPAGLFAVRRHWPDLGAYACVGVAVALPAVGLAAVVVPADEPVTLYAAVAVLLATLGGAARADVALRVAGVGLLVVSVVTAVPVTLTALVAPYGDVPPWSGAPTVRADTDALPVGLALTALAVAGVLAGRFVRPGAAAPLVRPGAAQEAVPSAGAAWWRAGLVAVPFAAAALPVLQMAAGVPWPVLPVVTLLGGVALVLAAALAAPRPLLAPVGVPVGLVLAASGLLGLLATRAGTIAGLGVLVVAATVVGVAARRDDARLSGALVAVAAATGLAVVAPLAGGLPVRTAAFSVLAVAVLTLAAAAAVPAHRGRSVAVALDAAAQAVALDAAAQAVALVALLLAVGSLRHAAAVCVLWGAAVALRVLRRGESSGRRWVFAGIAGGSELLGGWLLLAAGDVALLEAYTVPAAALALAAGVVALRTRPGLTSWLALGPGLAAALLPSLVSVLVAPDPQPWRRLLLGVAALGAVLAGATRRWQAPVLLGGVTLALLALHELVRGWDLLPRWIFLAVGGLTLIGLATTYERRRRDLARLRAALGRMG
ncbi:SCO7613 C-terminal domain-containing membrane protein [Micromonospora sp. SD12]|uniref:SCO7613 C-terminal domain-containing membrane protein n=1 Tax=Micromonospora sp. SD12 TaxID=3452216 RepID=UPI003F89970E